MTDDTLASFDPVDPAAVERVVLGQFTLCEWNGHTGGETELEDRLRGLGFNTVGNWSDRAVASDAGVPYTRQLCVAFPGTPLVYRDFPDVHHEAFPDDAADIAAPLEETLWDPAMIGYFLGNGPDWRAGTEPVAVAMLQAAESCATRRELADWLADRYGLGESTGSRDGTADQDQADDCDPDSLADAWNMAVTLADVPADWVLEGMVGAWPLRRRERQRRLLRRLSPPLRTAGGAARETHDRLYALANREVGPYGEAPSYLSSR